MICYAGDEVLRVSNEAQQRDISLQGVIRELSEKTYKLIGLFGFVPEDVPKGSRQDGSLSTTENRIWEAYDQLDKLDYEIGRILNAVERVNMAISTTVKG